MLSYVESESKQGSYPMHIHDYLLSMFLRYRWPFQSPTQTEVKSDLEGEQERQTRKLTKPNFSVR